MPIEICIITYRLSRPLTSPQRYSILAPGIWDMQVCQRFFFSPGVHAAKPTTLNGCRELPLKLEGFASRFDQRGSRSGSAPPTMITLFRDEDHGLEQICALQSYARSKPACGLAATSPLSCAFLERLKGPTTKGHQRWTLHIVHVRGGTCVQIRVGRTMRFVLSVPSTREWKERRFHADVDRTVQQTFSLSALVKKSQSRSCFALPICTSLTSQ